MSLQGIASLGKMLAQRMGRRHCLNCSQRVAQCFAEKKHVPSAISGHIEFLTKSQIALQLIDQSIADGITAQAWTFDENYGRDGQFLAKSVSSSSRIHHFETPLLLRDQSLGDFAFAIIRSCDWLPRDVTE